VGKLSTVTKVNDVHPTAKRAVKPPSKPRTAELFWRINIRHNATTEEKKSERPIGKRE